MCISDHRRVSERHFSTFEAVEKVASSAQCRLYKKNNRDQASLWHPEKTLNHRFLQRFEHDNDQTTSQTQAMEGTLKGAHQLLHLTILEGREGDAWGNLAPATLTGPVHCS